MERFTERHAQNKDNSRIEEKKSKVMGKIDVKVLNYLVLSDSVRLILAN